MSKQNHKEARLNVYIKNFGIIKEAKIQAVKEDKSLSQWVEEAIVEKLKKK